LTTYEEFYHLEEEEGIYQCVLDIKVTQDLLTQTVKVPLEFRQLFIKKYFENNFGDIDKFIQYKRDSSLQKQTMFQFQKGMRILYDL